MKTTKLFSLLLPCALIIGAVACEKKEEPASVVEISEELKVHGIETDMQSAIIEVPIQAKGKWFGALDVDADWVSLGDHAMEYDGPQTLRLAFDENRTGADRRTTLYLYDSKDQVTEVPVRQYYNYEGEAPTNGSGQAFADKGLGCGIDYDYVLDVKGIKKRLVMEDAQVASGVMTDEDRTQFEPTKVKKNNNIFNITRIEQLIEERHLQHSAYTETIIPLADLQAEMLDSSLVQDKTTNLSLKLKVAFGPITFQASVGYESEKKESRAFVDYTIVRHAPMYNVTLSEAEIASYAEDFMVDEMPSAEEIKAALEDIKAMRENYLAINAAKGVEGLTAAQQKKIDQKYAKLDRPTFDNVFSTSFARMYWDLYSAVAEEDDERANKVLNNIDNYYGPFFISGGDFGGALICHAQVDTLRMQGSATVTGDLAAAMNGVFQVTGKFEYWENGYDVLHNSNCKFYIYGGNANQTASELWAICMGGSPDDLNKWQQTLQAWVGSMYSPTDNSPLMSQAAPLSFNCIPIWTLFFDYDMQQYAQEWFMNRYADRGIYEYLGIMRGEKSMTPEDLYDMY